jgi:hypothetical protein
MFSCSKLTFCVHSNCDWVNQILWCLILKQTSMSTHYVVHYKFFIKKKANTDIFRSTHSTCPCWVQTAAHCHIPVFSGQRSQGHRLSISFWLAFTLWIWLQSPLFLIWPSPFHSGISKHLRKKNQYGVVGKLWGCHQKCSDFIVSSFLPNLLNPHYYKKPLLSQESKYCDKCKCFYLFYKTSLMNWSSIHPFAICVDIVTDDS